MLLDPLMGRLDIRGHQREECYRRISIGQIEMMNGLAVIMNGAGAMVVGFTLLIAQLVVAAFCVARMKQWVEQMNTDRQIKNGQCSQP